MTFKTIGKLQTILAVVAIIVTVTDPVWPLV